MAARPTRFDSPGADRDAVRRYWDAHPISTDSVPWARGTAESFDAIYARWERDMNPRRLGFLQSCAGERLLEVGCGIAIDGRFLTSHGAHYQAVDLSMESLKLASQHFRLMDFPARFANADGTRLPFADETFDVVYSVGVLHHVPDMAAACREVARVTRPGGRVRLMFYHRHSYHYALVHFVLRPLIWLLLTLPGGAKLAKLAPTKVRNMFEVCRRFGFDAQRVLNISTDTSTAEEDDFNPLSYFLGTEDVKRLFARLEDFEFYTTNLRGFPLRFLHGFVERRWGFFLQVTARKPVRRAASN